MVLTYLFIKKTPLFMVIPPSDQTRRTMISGFKDSWKFGEDLFFSKRGELRKTSQVKSPGTIPVSGPGRPVVSPNRVLLSPTGDLTGPSFVESAGPDTTDKLQQSDTTRQSFPSTETGPQPQYWILVWYSLNHKPFPWCSICSLPGYSPLEGLYDECDDELIIVSECYHIKFTCSTI